jgi:hypothetical protein
VNIPDERDEAIRDLCRARTDAARIIAISQHSVSYRWTHRESGEKRVTTVKGLEPRPGGRAETDCDEGAAPQG